MDESGYIHGTSADEQARLRLMNDLLNDRELDVLGLRGGERCLEVGAGTAVFAAALARRVDPGGGRVLAIERDEQQLEAARRTAAGVTNLELRRGDALALPLTADELGDFDLVHARFLLEHVTRPLDVVRAMVSAARPGTGRIAIVDDDHPQLQLYPIPPAFMALWDVYTQQFSRLGYDAIIGRRLVELLHRAGARPVRVDGVFYGGCSGMPSFAGLVDNLVRVVGGATDVMIESDSASIDTIDRGLDELRAWSAREDAAIWYWLPFAEGVRAR